MVAEHTGYVSTRDARLFFRDVGQGQPIIVIHGGPDFDHTYLLPHMDRLSDAYRLIYYDQRGRGKSEGDIENISIASEIKDIEALRQYFGFEQVTVLGHSWGGMLALIYALQYTDIVSHIILLNTSVASYEDFVVFQEERIRRLSVHADKMDTLAESPAYLEGDPAAVASRYRLYFSTTFKNPEHLDKLELDFKNFTRSGIRRAREIEARLFDETWYDSDFNLISDLSDLNVPTLILHGDYDFIPVKTVRRIADALPDAHVRLLKHCGHFSFIEAPQQVRQSIDQFLEG